jgi:hypothetical protein
MSKKFLIILICSCIYTATHGQNQANVWTFGLNAGLDFNNLQNIGGVQYPTPIHSEVQTNEGVASICDNSGRLLFYTDGISIWSGNGALMTYQNTGQIVNNLLGHASSTQSAIIVPDPSNNNQFYVFQVDQLGGTNGIHYSIVNITLNGGLGQVISVNNQNIIRLTPPGINFSEKIVAIPNCNNDGFWIICHNFGTTTSTEFYVYPLTNNGIGNVTTQNIGSVHNGVIMGTSINVNSVGYLKASPDGRRIVSVQRNNLTELFDFNRSNGTITNPTIINSTSNTINPITMNYGVEFSPNCNLLYLSSFQVNSTKQIYQYNLTGINLANANASTSIIATQRTIIVDNANSIPSNIGALQNGPDGKMYIAQSYSGYSNISVINNPNNYNLNNQNECGFVVNAISLDLPNTPIQEMSTSGFPSFVSGFINTNLSLTTINNCGSSLATFTAGFSNNTLINPQYSWNFGDGSTGFTQNPTTTHSYSASGTYSVTLTITASNIICPISITESLIVNIIPQMSTWINFSENGNCGKTYNFNGQTSYIPQTSEFTWNFGDGTPIVLGQSVSHTYGQPGSYNVTLTNNYSNLCGSFTTIIDTTLVVDDNCCYASTDSAFTKINTPITISNNSIWHGKYYVSPNVIITVDNGSILDLTNVDIVFGECAGFDFINGAKLRANNSVFRPCNVDESWRGFMFYKGSTGIVEQCIFKNAYKALQFKGNDVENVLDCRIENNNFYNNKIAIDFSQLSFNESITGNTFNIENSNIDFTNICYENNFSERDFYAIRGILTNFNGMISQNSFINSSELDNGLERRIYGIYFFDEVNYARINSNTFTNMYSVFEASNCNVISFENNNCISSERFEFNNSFCRTYKSSKFYFSRNNFRVTEDDFGIASNNMGLVIQSSNNFKIFDNEFEGLGVSIETIFSDDVEILDNKVMNGIYGIANIDGNNVSLKCNYINLNSTSNSNFQSTGIINMQIFKKPDLNSKIFTNCIKNCYNSILLLSYYSNLIPDIKNNFLYNYNNSGIENQGYVGTIGNGFGFTNSAHNTFVSNNTNNFAVDIRTTTPLTVSGNYGISTIQGNISLQGNNTFNSTSSCGNQIATLNNNVLNTEESCFSDMLFYKLFFKINGKIQLSSNFEELLSNIDENRKYNMIKEIAYLLKTNNDNSLRIRTEFLINKINDNEQKTMLRYYIQTLLGDYSLAYSTLSLLSESVNKKWLSIKNNALSQKINISEFIKNERNLLESFANEDKLVRDIKHYKDGDNPFNYYDLKIVRPMFIDEIIKIEKEVTVTGYPNPFSDVLTLQYSNNSNESKAEIKLRITDLFGRIIFDQKVNNFFDQIILNTKQFAKGIFYISLLKDNKTIETQKLIKN